MPFGLSAGAIAAIGAGVAAAGSVGGALISSSAASSAASKQQQAANQATQATQDQQAVSRADLAPYRDLGLFGKDQLVAGLPTYIAPFTGQAPAAFNFNPSQADLEATPGYKFTLDQGLKSVQNAASAKGLGVSGAALKGAADYSTGLANNTWNSVFNADLGQYNANLAGYNAAFNVDQANKTNAYNKLMGLVGAGQSSAAQTGAFGQQATQNAGNFLTSGANAAAAGTVGSANALSSGLGNAGSTVNQSLLLNRLLSNNSNSTSGGSNQNFVDNGNFTA